MGCCAGKQRGRTREIRQLAQEARELAQEFRDAANTLEDCAEQVNAVKVKAGTANVAGTVLAGISMLAAPLTGGVSVLIGAGACASMAGAAVSMGADLYRSITEQSTIKSLNIKWEAFRGKDQIGVRMKNSEEDLQAQLTLMFGSVLKNVGNMQELLSLAKTLRKAKGPGFDGVKAASTSSKMASGSLAIVGLYFSVQDLVNLIAEVKSTADHPVGTAFRNIAKSLETFARQTEKKKRCCSSCCCC